MTKQKLLKLLEKVPDDAEIILSSDPEGNSYLPLTDVMFEPGLKFAKDGYEISLFDEEDIEDGYINLNEYSKAKNCVVFYP